MQQTEFVNKVDASGILTIDLIDYEPKQKSLFIDIKDYLYQGMIIKEKEFKAALTETDWEQYSNRPVAISCTEEDSIIPTWVYMSLASQLDSIASSICYCKPEELDLKIWNSNIEKADFDHLANKKVVVRARVDMHPSLYFSITQKLKPIVKTLMYGEAGLPKVIYKN